MKKIILSLLLAFLMMISLSAISACEDFDDAVCCKNSDSTVDHISSDDLANMNNLYSDNLANMNKLSSEYTARNEGQIAEGENVDTIGDESSPILTDDVINNASAIQDAINRANPGDKIKLNGTYDLGNTKIFITKNITLEGNGSTIIRGYTANREGIIYMDVTARGAVIQGITFINSFENATNPKYGRYDPAKGETLKGFAIEMSGAQSNIINNCRFLNFNSGIYAQTCDNLIISNNYFNGTSTWVTNNGQSSPKEAGTKAVNIMGSTGISVLNNTFEGPVLDAISIAGNSNSYRNTVEGNTFNGSVYAIYFGGASYGKIKNNTFIDCGHFETDATDENGIPYQNFTDIPIISCQKNGANFEISENTFKVRDGSSIIALEEENQAHGYPSASGNVNITKNEIIALNDTENHEITFVHFLSNVGTIDPKAPINISGNIVEDGVKIFDFWSGDWGDENGNVYIPAYSGIETTLTPEWISSSDGKVIMILKDINGDPVPGALIEYYINGEHGIDYTDDNGQIAISKLQGENYLEFEFKTDYVDGILYKGSNAELDFEGLIQTKTHFEAGNLKTLVNSPNTYSFTLKDENNKILANRTVHIIFNNKEYMTRTDNNGVGKIEINLASSGTYLISGTYSSENGYVGSRFVSTITAIKDDVKFSSAIKKVKKSTAKKTFKITLKTSTGQSLAGQTVKITINKKTYSAKTNSKGIVTFKLKLAKKKKTYSYVVKFEGDSAYNAKMYSGKLKVI